MLLGLVVLTTSSPAEAYYVRWDIPIAAGQMGYMTTFTPNLGGVVNPNEVYWAPTQAPGADLDGDGIMEFITNVGGDPNGKTYVMDGLTGSIEFTHTWPGGVGQYVNSIAYLDIDPSDGVSDVIVQAGMHVFCIGGGTSPISAPHTPANSDEGELTLSSRPNPSSGLAEIVFSVPESGMVSVRVFDVSGRLVRELLNAEVPTGQHSLDWDGLNEDGRPVAAGAYIARISTRAGRESRKMIMLR
jgi:hypothetical protein